MEDVVAQMRADVNVSLVGQGSEFVSRQLRERQRGTARKVTERLASLYIEQNLNDRETQADSTSQFLGTQLEEAKRRLIEQEEEARGLPQAARRPAADAVAGKSAGHPERQPAAAGVERIDEPRAGAPAADRAADRRRRRPCRCPRRLAPVADDAGAVTGTPAQQLELARARLAAYLQRYTPDHPEVVSLRAPDR